MTILKDLEARYRRCSKASEVLDGRMFGKPKAGLAKDEIEAILQEAVRIHQDYHAIATLFQVNSASQKLLSNMYYDWGIHCKQLAWFYYAEPRDIQQTIGANNLAIEQMELSLTHSTTERGRKKVQSEIDAYRLAAQVLNAELSSEVKEDVHTKSTTQNSSKRVLEDDMVENAVTKSRKSESSHASQWGRIGKKVLISVDTTLPSTLAALLSSQSFSSSSSPWAAASPLYRRFKLKGYSVGSIFSPGSFDEHDLNSLDSEIRPLLPNGKR